MTPLDETPPIRDRYRIRFAKTGLLRWIGHRDLQRLWQRVLRRADLRLSMSQGFHPKPRIHFPSALPLGFQGIDEVTEVELAESDNAATLDLCRIDAAIASLKSQTFLRVSRNGQEIAAHVATSFPVFHRLDRVLHLVQVDNDGASLKPTEILDAIGLADLIEQGATICRTRVILVDQPKPHFPDLDRTPMFPDLITNKNHTLTDNLFKERI